MSELEFSPEPLKPEHVLHLIQHKRQIGRTPEQILETLEFWLNNVAATGGVIVE